MSWEEKKSARVMCLQVATNAVGEGAGFFTFRCAATSTAHLVMRSFMARTPFSPGINIYCSYNRHNCILASTIFSKIFFALCGGCAVRVSIRSFHHTHIKSLRVVQFPSLWGRCLAQWKLRCCLLGMHVL